MALDEFFETEVAIAAGITAAALSPRVRKVVRRGAVLGLAGVLSAGDAVVNAAKGAAEEARQRADSDGGEAAPAPRQRKSAATT